MGWSECKALSVPLAKKFAPGESITAKAKAAGISQQAVSQRLRSGMSIEEALAVKVRSADEVRERNMRLLEAKASGKRLVEIAEQFGLSVSHVKDTIRRVRDNKPRIRAPRKKRKSV